MQFLLCVITIIQPLVSFPYALFLGTTFPHTILPTHPLQKVTLDGFRRNRFRVLVATDVAARGLDITGVELVVQVEPPNEAETYIHRSGRTGRANTSGVSITMVAKKKEYMIPIIERKGGFKFERIGPPQPQDIARVAGERAVQAVKVCFCAGGGGDTRCSWQQCFFIVQQVYTTGVYMCYMTTIHAYHTPPTHKTGC